MIMIMIMIIRLEALRIAPSVIGASLHTLCIEIKWTDPTARTHEIFVDSIEGFHGGHVGRLKQYNWTVCMKIDLISQRRENVLFCPPTGRQWRHMKMLYSQNNKTAWLSSIEDIFLRSLRGVHRFVGIFLDCVFRVLIGWVSKLRSRGDAVYWTILLSDRSAPD